MGNWASWGPYKWSWTPTYIWFLGPPGTNLIPQTQPASTCSPLDCDFHDFKTIPMVEKLDQGVSKNNGTPKSYILIGFWIINHPFWGIPIFGNTHQQLNNHHLAQNKNPNLSRSPPVGVWKPPSICNKKSAQIGNLNLFFFVENVQNKKTFFKTLDLLKVLGKESKDIPQMVV